MYFLNKYKKIIFIISFIFIIFILGYILYALFFTSAPPINQPKFKKTSTSTAGLPISGKNDTKFKKTTQKTTLPSDHYQAKQTKANAIAQGGLTQTKQLNNTPSLGATLSADGSSIQYYDKTNGKFFRIDNNGEMQSLSDKIFHSVKKITWAKNKNKAILEYPDGANILYNFQTKKQITLPKHWKDFDFSPDSSKIVMKSIGLDPGNRWLAVANDDGSKVKAIEPLGNKDATVYPDWSPGGQMVAMFTEGIDFNRQHVYFVGLNKENFKSTVIEGRGFEPKWSPKGDQLVYSAYSSRNDLKPMLWVVNAQGENIGSGRKSLGLETWANKCSFANKNELYCAVPKNLPQGAGIFPEMEKTTTDQIYKINIKTGLKKLIATPDNDYSMSDLMISDNGYYLYFLDNKDKTIHKIKLK